MKALETMAFGIAAWLVAGCSGGVTVLPAGPPGADGGSPQDSGVPATDGGAPGSDSGAPGVDSGPWSPVCPVDIPTAGTPCAPSELNCGTATAPSRSATRSPSACSAHPSG
jgi:hypothetical protein